MFKALGKTWMRRQKQPGNVFSGRQLQQPLGTWQAVPEQGGAECPLEGGRDLPFASGFSGSGPILGALRMLLPGILESTLEDRHLMLPSGRLAWEGEEKWPS